MGRPRLYPDDKTKWRMVKRKSRRDKKPYYAKQRALRQQLEDPALQHLKAAQGVYDVLVIDPPWPVAFQAGKTRPQQGSLAYPTMTLDAIRALQLPLADVAHVWLWTTQRFLPAAFGYLDAWGLRYVCEFVWIKPGGMQPMDLPQFTTESALYARKGPAVLLDTKNLPTHFKAARGPHSAKPDVFYAMVRRVTAGRRLDMFSRRCIEGFEAWGYEAPGLGQAEAAG